MILRLKKYNDTSTEKLERTGGNRRNEQHI